MGLQQAAEAGTLSPRDVDDLEVDRGGEVGGDGRGRGIDVGQCVSQQQARQQVAGEVAPHLGRLQPVGQLQGRILM